MLMAPSYVAPPPCCLQASDPQTCGWMAFLVQTLKQLLSTVARLDTSSPGGAGNPQLALEKQHVVSILNALGKARGPRTELLPCHAVCARVHSPEVQTRVRDLTSRPGATGPGLGPQVWGQWGENARSARLGSCPCLVLSAQGSLCREATDLKWRCPSGMFSAHGLAAALQGGGWLSMQQWCCIEPDIQDRAWGR